LKVFWVTCSRVRATSATEERNVKVNANTVLVRVCGVAAAIVIGGGGVIRSLRGNQTKKEPADTGAPAAV
jgi:hypothetical protein